MISEEIIVPFLVVALFSMVQSVFGVGLLLFGTPTLLMFGHPFEQALSILLPCSLVISLLQVLQDRSSVQTTAGEIIGFTLPALLVGLGFVLYWGHAYNARFAVGLMLVLTGLMRSFSGLSLFLTRLVSHCRRPYLLVMGLIHGLTNMGGGLLAIYANAQSEEKRMIRSCIAFGYLLMALTQVGFLVFWNSFVLDRRSVILPVLAGSVYLILGNRIFQAASHYVYQGAMTVFLLLFGITLIFV
ncbi:MAG: hypothetical protein HYW02_01105 [Deltaproteobacteria bacterium]|nr:hypothetical protein [Deltaproteobacteria bacterium]MBI2500079.1 hypothetical protein [Deltaproteobacteria bacterium]